MFACGLSISAQAQDLIWAKQTGENNEAHGYGIDVLPDGSSLVTGDFRTTVSFGPGEIGETVLTSTGDGLDLFVARYNPDGTLAWVKQAGGSADDVGSGISVMADGSSLVTGYFNSTATFGLGEPGQTTLNSAGSWDIFVARYNPDGTLAWAKRAGGGSIYDESGTDISVMADGSALVTGYFRETATFGPGEPGQTILTSAGGSDIFVARYNPNGTLAWAKRAGSSDEEFGDGVSVLADGSALVTGDFNNTATFGPGEPAETTLTSAGGLDIFVARYNPDGTLAWVKQAGGSIWDEGEGIAVLPDGSALVTGWFEDTATFGPGESGETTLTSAGFWDIFAAHYNPDGTLAWAKRAGGSSEDTGLGISVLADGSALVSGEFYATAIFGPGEPGEATVTSAGMNDIFVARYNPHGTLASVKRAGGVDLDRGWEISVLPDGSALVTGTFRETVTFGPGEPGETILTSSGEHGMFVAKFSDLRCARSHWSLYF